MTLDCVLCRGAEADAELDRVEVWANEFWRFTTSCGEGEVLAGFSYLDPRRHIEDIAALDGTEAETFGPVVARITSALKAVTRCERVYVYVFGDSVPHLHLHLVPHTKGDAASEAIIRGEVVERKMPSGVVQIVSSEFPIIPIDELFDVVDGLRERLGTSRS